MSTPETQPTVAVIGAGLDLGAGRRGVDMGPSAIRYAELAERIRSLGRHVIDQGDVRAVASSIRQSTLRQSAPSVASVSRYGAQPLT